MLAYDLCSLDLWYASTACRSTNEWFVYRPSALTLLQLAMPSMRLNTQAAAGLADPTEWQTVSAKAKVKTKTKSEVRCSRAKPVQGVLVFGISK